MLLIQLGARLRPLGGAEYAEDLCIAGEVVERCRRLGGTLPCRYHRRRGHYNQLDAQPIPLIDAQRRGGHVGALHIIGDLTVGE